MPVKYEKPEGLTEKELREFEETLEVTEEAIRNRICPECGSELSKKLDPQAARDLWFRYQCMNGICDFFLEQLELN